MIDLDRLRTMELFAELTPDCAVWLGRHLTEIRVAAGDALLNEGEEAKGFFVLLQGEILVLRKSDGQDMPIGRHTALAFFGEAPLLAGTPVAVTLRAVGDARLARLSDEAFFELLADSPHFRRVIFRMMASRSAGLESFVRQREKMAALGTLAAGLSHELNNPAAAVARSAERMRSTLEQLYAAQCALREDSIPAESLKALDALRRRAPTSAEQRSPLELSELEETLADWLSERGVRECWNLAPVLVAAGLAAEDLEPVAARMPAASIAAGIGWLAAAVDMAALMDESSRAAARISEIVKAMKSYSYMDRAPLQEADVHDGLEDTLTILRHKLKRGIEVTRDYDRALPRLSVIGAELNQVWTNLIDNAADALEGKGHIMIRTRRENDCVLVEIADDGPGIPKEIQSRIFEPFFTTKPVGKGSGLGLDIAHKIVINRHGGSIRVESRPGNTCFQVRLPLPKETT